MKACGCSARDVRRAEEQLSVQVAGATQKKVLILAGGVILLGALALAFAPEDPPQALPTPASSHSRAAEAAIYSALDARDASRVAEALQHLQSDEDPIRLAAARYLVTIDPEPYLERLLPLMDDPSQRVRLATIQLLGRTRKVSKGSSTLISEKLLQVVFSDNRSVAEKLTAHSGLQTHRVADPTRLLPLLDDPQLAEATSMLLAQSTGQHVGVQKSGTLRQAWTVALRGDR